MSGSDDIFGSGSDSDEETAVAQPVVSANSGGEPTAEAEEEKPTAEAPMGTVLLPKQQASNPEEKVFTSVLPNIIGINTECFDERTFLDQFDEDEQDASKSVIRWKYRDNDKGELERDEGGNPIMESNARMVRWSDGSMQLMVGAEVFDVEATLHKDGVLNQYLFNQQTDQDGDTVLQCSSKLHGRLSFKPSSLTSAAHRELATRIRSKHMRTKKVQEIHTTANPEVAKAKREQSLGDKIRKKEQKKRRREHEGSGGAGRRMNKRFLEEGQEEDEEEQLERMDDDYTDDGDEEEGDISALKGKKPRKAPANRSGKPSLSSHMSSRAEAGEGEEMERGGSEESAEESAVDADSSSSSEDEAVVSVKKRSNKASLLDDDSDSE